MSEKELTKYVMDEGNHLSRKVNYDGYEITVNYRPTDLLIAQELRGQPTDQEELERLHGKYSKNDYFILSMSKNDQEALYQQRKGYGQFSDLVQTLSFRMAEYVNMTTSAKDTVEVADYIFQRTYGMAGASNLLFVFHKERSSEVDWIQFNMKEFGLGLGNQTFRFRRSDLDKVPKIDFMAASSAKSNNRYTSMK